MSSFTIILIIIVLAAIILLFGWLHVIGERANVADWGAGWTNRLDGLNRLFCRHYHHLDPEPLHIPDSGPALVACNHVSGLDPLLLVAASHRPLRFIIAAEQYHRFGLNWLFRAAGCIPVDRSGRPEKAFREALRALHAGEVVALFPHGKIHLDNDPPRPLKGGVYKLSQMAKCPIVPARLTGIRGEGHTVLAVLIHSRAHVHSYRPLDCSGIEAKPCLVELDKIISGKIERNTGTD